MNYKLKALTVLAAAFFVAQLKADVTGAIVGTVHDASSAAVVGAQVIATNTSTNFTKETKSDASGEYRFLALPPGPYRVTATAAGFDQFVSTGIDLKVNDQLRVDVSLKVGTVKESVTVEASAVQVETETTQLGQVFRDQADLEPPVKWPQLYRFAVSTGRCGAHDIWLHSARPAGIGHFKRGQRVGEWPTRNGKRVPGERRRCE